MFVGEKLLIRMQSQSLWLTITSATNKVIRHMNVGLEPQMYLNLKETATIIKSIDIKNLNVDPSPQGHQTS